MEVLTVKEYSERYGVPVRTINYQLSMNRLPNGVSSYKKAEGKTAVNLLYMSTQKKPKKR